MPDSFALLLPSEVWLAILDSLTYMDLRRARRINKRFYRLVQDPKFDLALFRKSLVPASESEIEYKLHPVLNEFGLTDRMTNTMAPLLHWHREWIVSDEWHGGRTVPSSNFFDFPVCDEFVTAPACTHFRVLYDQHVLADVVDGRGVTVRQVLFAYADFWAKPVDPRWEDQYRRQRDLPDNEFVSKSEALLISFSGWRPLKYSYNDVRLEARLFTDGLREELDALFNRVRGSRIPQSSGSRSTAASPGLDSDSTEGDESDEDEW